MEASRSIRPIEILAALAAAPLMIAGLLLLGACGGESQTGLEGNLTFTGGDWAEEADGKVVELTAERGLAVGAMLDMRVSMDGSSVEVAEVEFDDKGILRVSSIDGSRIVLVGESPGETIMRVTTAGGVSDGIPLSVDALDRVEIVQSDLLSATCRVDACLDGQTHSADNVAVFGGSTLHLQAAYLNASGDRLLGYGISKWSGDGIEDETVGAVLDRGSIEVPVPAGAETFSVSYGEASLELPVVDASAVSRLEAPSYAAGGNVRDDAGTITIHAGTSATIVAVPYDAEDRLIVGGGGWANVINAEAIAPTLTTDDTDRSGDAESDFSRSVVVVAEEPGEATVQVDLLGHKAEATVVATAPPDSDG